MNENLLIATWNIQQISNQHTNRAIQCIAGICERREEIQQMVDFLHRRAGVGKDKVFDRGFLVLSDLNVEKHDNPFLDALVSRGFKISDGMNPLATNFGSSKSFYKIAWVNRKQFRHTEDCNVVPFYKALFQDATPKGGRTQASDHFLLWV